MKAVLFALALFALQVSAEETLKATNGEDSVWLYDRPCSTPEVLNRVAPRLRDIMRDAKAFVRGQSYAACWIVNGDSAHLIYEDGDQGLIPLTDFAPEKGSRALDGKTL